MKILLIILSFLFLTGDTLKLSFLSEINTAYSKAYVDALGFVYTISNNNISKFDSNGKKQHEYCNKLFGNICQIDVSDPFRIAVFYKDFEKLVFLNNALSELRSTINISELGIENPELVCSSSNGGFWIFDSKLQKLIYFDQNLKKQQESVSLLSISSDTAKPVSIEEKNNNIYMSLSSTGIHVFDKYGAYLKKVPLVGNCGYTIDENSISYFAENKIVKYNSKFLNEQYILLPDSLQNAKNAIVTGNILYMFNQNKIKAYNILNQ